VHVILKATSEQGKRLNIKKAQLKEWRLKFAAHLVSLVSCQCGRPDV